MYGQAAGTGSEYGVRTLQALANMQYLSTVTIANLPDLLQPFINSGFGVAAKQVFKNTFKPSERFSIIGNFFNRLFGKKDVYNLQPTWVPYHVFGFNPKALRILLDENNIEINEILIHGVPGMPFAGGIKDRIKVLVAILIQRLANVMSLGTNMYIWGKKL